MDALIHRYRRDGLVAMMGVLNVTPDSFSDGGRFVAADQWRTQIDRLIDEGADIIDVGGESTRPGAAAVTADEQKTRVIEPVRYAASRGVLVSIDTADPDVADAALEAGAHIVNDVSCLADARLAEVTRDRGASLIIMHSRGAMSAMAGFSEYPRDGYGDVVREVLDELRAARERAEGKGLSRERVLFDPGLGFHKSAEQSYALLGRLASLCAEAPVVFGASRKSFLAKDVPAPPALRLGGSIAAALIATREGAAVVRVHDVLATRQALAVERAAREAVMLAQRGGS